MLRAQAEPEERRCVSGDFWPAALGVVGINSSPEAGRRRVTRHVRQRVSDGGNVPLRPRRRPTAGTEVFQDQDRPRTVLPCQQARQPGTVQVLVGMMFQTEPICGRQVDSLLDEGGTSIAKSDQPASVISETAVYSGRGGLRTG
jgi:hypothetical protein